MKARRLPTFLPVFGAVWGVHLLLMLALSILLRGVRRPLRGQWFTIRGWEKRCFAWLGGGPFAAALDWSGWNTQVRCWRRFAGRRDLPTLAEHTRRSEVTHLGAALPGVVWAGWALWRRQWAIAAANALLLVGLHLYPVLLQRQLRARLERLP